MGPISTRRLLPAIVALSSLCAAAGNSPRTEITLGRIFDSSSGLRVSYCTNVRQDATGFLWIGTPGGVFRYDGQSFRLVLPVDAVAIGGTPRDPMLFKDSAGALWRTDGETALPVAGPDGLPSTGVRMAVVNADGTLWAVRGDRLWRRDPGEAWHAADVSGVERINVLFAGRDSSALAGTDDALIRVAADGAVTPLAPAPQPWVARASADGSILFGCGDGSVHRWASGRDVVLFRDPHRMIDVEHRGSTDWVAYDTGLIALRPDADPVRVIATTNRYPVGGLLADREGSLWIATPQGLMQLPEPDTRFGDDSGGGRSFAVAGNTIWIALWSGLRRAERGAGNVEWRRVPGGSIYPPCADAEGRIWQATQDRFHVWRPDGTMEAISSPGLRGNWRCSLGNDGSLWIPTNLGVFRLESKAAAPRRVVAAIPGGEAFPDSGYRAFESRDGELFVARGDRICRTRVSDALRAGDVAWDCQTFEDAEMWSGFATLPSGATWAAVGHRGFARFRKGHWEPIPGSARLPSSWTTAITRNPDGTVWLTGSGFAVRVVEREESPDGWEIVEQLGAAQGVPAFNIADALQDPDGSVWLSSDVGVQHVPPDARRPPTAPPRVALVEASIDGRPVATGATLRLPYQRNRLELRFAAASYRDSSLVRYRSRVRPDEPWSPATPNPHFRFVDVAPGNYRVEVEATVDGTHWSPAPAIFAFSVDRPWYRQPWAYGAALFVIGGAAFAAYRARVVVLLRLERQRARIAMDLHDELGSGLGTIGILAGVASRPGLDPERRAALVERIAGVSKQLGGSLTDMVWTLKRGASNTVSLAAHLRERGEAMFPGPEPALEVDMPDPIPRIPLSLAVRRNVALIGLEALHNAARHAGARKVILSLHPGKRRWVLAVRDDGRGLAEAGPAAPGHGTGLAGMRRRADRIGARLGVEGSPGGGTVVRLEFLPGAEEKDDADSGHDHATGRRPSPRR